MRTIALAITAAFAVAPLIAEARITSVTWDPARSQAPSMFPGQSAAFGGLSFGGVGQYEKLRGTATGELDPNDPRNKVITDIELATRNAAGMVTYSMDVFILRPLNQANGNQRLFYDFNNRGQMRLGRLNNGTVTSDPVTAADAGDGYVMRHGFSVAGNGWDFGATGTANLKISVPRLTGLPGPSYEYIVNDNAITMSVGLTFPANTLVKSLAKLTVRARLDDAPVTLSDSQWEYTSAAGTAIRLLPLGTPFQQSAIYEFWYTAKDPVVSGVGLAASRDWVSFLRHASAAEGNPLAGYVQYTYSYSISQPSRTLNDFVLFGFNEDLQGRRVIDGILSHTGGGSGDQINYRYGQTGRTERNRQNHLYPEGVFPFAHQTLTDHLSGKTGGRDERCAASNTCPKRFEVNTSNEHWVKAGSLLHSDTHGKDLKEPDDVRYYLMSGQSHQRRQPLPRAPRAAARARPLGEQRSQTAEERDPARRPPRLGHHAARLAGRCRAAKRARLAEHSGRAVHRRDHHPLLARLRRNARRRHHQQLPAIGRRPALVQDLRLEGRRGRQRDRRRAHAGRRGADRHHHRLGAAPRRVRRARRLRVRRAEHPVRAHQGRAQGERRPAQVARGALQGPRRLRQGGRQGRAQTAEGRIPRRRRRAALRR